MSETGFQSPAPKAAKWGFITALVLTIVWAIAALWTPIPSFFYALTFLAIAIGLRKGKAWSGYGGALLLSASAGVALMGLMRGTRPPLGALIVAVGLNGLVAFIFFRAGRSLPSRQPAWSGIGWIGLAVGYFLFFVVFQPFVIPTGAMERTILIGDYVLVRRIGVSSPWRGDLVVHRYPPDQKQIFVKRIVAVGNDRVRLRNKQLFINGSPAYEPYAIHTTSYIDEFRDNFPQEPNVSLRGQEWEALVRASAGGDLIVPQGKFFVMGDNRDNSLDSRYWGFLEAKDIVGQPAMVYFSADRSTDSLSAKTPAVPALLNPGSVRWHRIFKLL